MKTYLSGIVGNFFMIEGNTIQSINCGKKNKKGIKFKTSDGTKGKLIFKNNHWSFEVNSKGSLFERIYKYVSKDVKHNSISDILVLSEGVEWVKIKGTKYILDTEVDADSKISFDVMEDDMLIGIGGQEVILNNEGVFNPNRKLMAKNFTDTKEITLEFLMENFSEKTTLGEIREVVDLMTTVKNETDEPVSV